MKQVPDGLSRVCLYDPGAVEVVVIGGRVARRQDAPGRGSVDLTPTLRCKRHRHLRRLPPGPTGFDLAILKTKAQMLTSTLC